MSSSVLTVADRLPVTHTISLYRDICELIKLRLSFLVLITVAVGGIVATWGQPDPITLFHAVIATGLIAASASIWNQWLERHTDALMPRTADRPIAAGRIGGTAALALGVATLLIGVGDLLLAVNRATAALGLTTWILYVIVYTPMKRVSPWNTLIGAIPGALPVLIGWVASGQPLDLRAAAMFLIVFFWQFPHFMAIAWKYRAQYANVGMKMVTVTDQSGRRAGIQAVVGSLALLPVSLIPALVVPPSMIYAVTVFALGTLMLVYSWRFWQDRSDQTARALFRTSLIYLPCVMLALACLPLIA